MQLWDPDEQAHYWYCERTQQAQWETPGQVQPSVASPDNHNALAVYNEQTGYESEGGLSRPGSSYSIAATDYSTDMGYSTDGADSAYGNDFGEGSSWQEYWDEQAQAKYWYNNDTGEASWTKPDEQMLLGYGMASEANNQVAIAGMGRADEWVSYIDEDTGQEYWYNTRTGETSWG